MRIIRTLFVFVVTLLATVALTTTTASAAIEIFDELDTGVSECPALEKTGHAVVGGCHFGIRSEHHIPLVVQTAGGPVTLSNCNISFEIRISRFGLAWAFEFKFSFEVQFPTNPTCTRAPCDEANGTEIPWPASISETAGTEVVESTFCMRTIASGPGGAGTQCEVHLPLSDNGSHQTEIGDSTTYTCENLPPVSIQNVHFVNDTEPAGPREYILVVH